MEESLGRFLFSLGCVVGLAACTEVTGRDLGCWVGLSACPEVVAGNELHVSVETYIGEAAAMQKAEAHCGQFGKLARLHGISSGKFMYHCVRQDL